MNVQSSSVRRVNVRRMAIIGVLSSISIMLSMVPGIGYIPIGPTNATIMHIPVIIGAIIEGPVVGMAIGAIFGLTSMFRALTMPTITSFPFLNPLVSVLPRILIGLVAYYVFKMCMKLSKNNSYISGWITGIIGSLINTGCVLGMIYVLYGAKYAEAFAESVGEAVQAVGVLIWGMVLTNGIPEALVGGLIVSALSVALNKRKK